MPSRSCLLILATLFPCVAQLFDPSRVTELRLELSPGRWEQLKTDYLLDTWYEASFARDAETPIRIGIRSRGNGSRSAAKPGLKLEFDKFAKGQTWHGAKSLVLDNHAQDPSFLHESLTFDLFETLDLPTPKVAYVNLFVNGESYGLYSAVEPIDKLFLQRTLGQDGGYLYGYEWVTEYWFHYAGPDPALYSPLPFAPKTNEKSSDAGALVEMIRITNESPTEDLPAELSRYLQIPRFLDYLAAETFLAERDGLAGDWGLNNFYLYRLQGTQQFLFLPWDKDFTFGPHDRSIWQNLDRNVLTRRLLEIPEHRDYFFRALERCASWSGGEGGPLDLAIESRAALIRPFVLADEKKPYPNGDFEVAVASLRWFAALRAGYVRNAIGR